MISENTDDRTSAKTANFMGPRASEITPQEDVSKRRVNSQDARDRMNGDVVAGEDPLESSKRLIEIEQKLQ